MAYLSRIVPLTPPAVSPLLLSDRLLTLAQDADKAGLRVAAEHLLQMASEVLDNPAPQHP
jgi:hypothetical protein